MKLENEHGFLLRQYTFKYKERLCKLQMFKLSTVKPFGQLQSFWLSFFSSILYISMPYQKYDMHNDN